MWWYYDSIVLSSFISRNTLTGRNFPCCLLENTVRPDEYLIPSLCQFRLLLSSKVTSELKSKLGMTWFSGCDDQSYLGSDHPHSSSTGLRWCLSLRGLFFSACEKDVYPFHDVFCFDLETAKLGLQVFLVSLSKK